MAAPPPLRSPDGSVVQQPAPTPPGGRRSGIETRYQSESDNRAWVIGLALAVLVLVAVGLLFVPPAGTVVENSATQASRAASADQGALATRADAAPGQAGVSREQARTALQDALQKQAELEVMRAPQWADRVWLGLIAQMTEADQAFRRGAFARAQQLWAQAGADFADLGNQRESYLQTHLDGGDAALAKDDAEAAIKAYEAALAADPDNTPAQTGAQRARQRPALLNALADAENAEQAQDLEAANEAYRRALEIDSLDQRARSGQIRIADALAAARFQAAMSQSLQAMEQGRYSAARQTLDQAAAIRPDDPAVRDLRTRLANAQRGSAIRNQRRLAAAAVAKEDWAAAVGYFQAALNIDPNAGFARDGLEQARQRQELHRQLDHYLARPERLYGAEPLNNAQALLKAAAGGGEPGLNAKLDKLRAEVAVASTPIALRLRSDGETDVSIYHVAQFGRFQDMGLELTPGDYTAVGVREGYRDVRRVFQVRPGVPLPPISIRCSEAL